MTPSGYLDEDGLWIEAVPDLQWAAGRPALFLDRDGVVVDEVNYLHRMEDVRMIHGAAAFIAEANRRRIPVILLSNQAGITHGHFGWPEFHAVQMLIAGNLEREGASFDMVLACPHHPRHPDRKPEPGMFRKAARIAGVDLRRSWVVGDKTSDLEAGRAAGLAGGVLVLTGHGRDHRECVSALRTPAFETGEEESLRTAAYVLDRLDESRQPV